MSEVVRAPVRPLIGIPTRRVRLAGREHLFHGTFDSYIDAVHAVGAAVTLLPDGDHDLTAARLCDGFIFVGGEDPGKREWWIDAGGLTGTDPIRDTFETEIALFAREAGTPTLGICRGLQIINCALGGQIRLLPAEKLLTHQASGVATGAGHAIAIAENSKLAALYQPDETLTVVSRHQAQVGILGAGLRAVAWSPDGTIEAAEASNWDFIGVQWHPEMSSSANSLNLFKWLVARCAKKDSER